MAKANKAATEPRDPFVAPPLAAVPNFATDWDADMQRAVQAWIEDQGVRHSREFGHCSEWKRYMVAMFPNGPLDGIEYRDSDGNDCNGNGWRDPDGYDRNGFNASGRDREGFDRNGFDADGFNREGVDNAGISRDDPRRFMYDYRGYDADGFNAQGLNRNGETREQAGQREVLELAGRFFDRNGRNPDGFDRYGASRDGSEYKREFEVSSSRYKREIAEHVKRWYAEGKIVLDDNAKRTLGITDEPAPQPADAEASATA